MTVGSGLLSKAKPGAAHLVKPGVGGVSGEVADLRQDVTKALAPLCALGVEEYTNLVGTAAPGAAVLLAATATVAAPVTILPAGLLAAGLAQLAAHARPLTFTTAGTTASDVPANVVINGLDTNGVAQSETLALSQTAAAVTSVNAYSAITSIVYPAADGTGGTVSIGIAAAYMRKAIATTVAVQTWLGSQLVQGVLQQAPRQLVFTTAGTTPADAPASVLITGRDVNNRVQTETLNLAQTAATATSVKYYKSIDSLVFAAGDGAGATIALSFGTNVGFARKILGRTGAFTLIRELMDGTVVTNGVVIAPSTATPNGAYTPNSLGNDAHDYAVYYEYDASDASAL